MIKSRTTKNGHIKTKISGTMPFLLCEYFKISQTMYEVLRERNPETALSLVNYIKSNVEKEIMVDNETFEKKSNLRDLEILALLKNEMNKSQ